jgi:hypothetical protein
MDAFLQVLPGYPFMDQQCTPGTVAKLTRPEQTEDETRTPGIFQGEGPVQTGGKHYYIAPFGKYIFSHSLC